MKICSACLLGIKCRYDGRGKPNKKVIDSSQEDILIPVCPEQLGGLLTPRESAERIGKKIFTKSGKDVTRSFRKGAERALKIAQIFNIREAILKQGSPSCGCGMIYDGSFSRKLIKGDGIMTELFRNNGIKIISEENL